MRTAIVFAAAVLVGCSAEGGTLTDPSNGPGGGTPQPNTPSTAQVEVRSSDDGYGYFIHSFVPGRVSVSRGGTVTWNNTSGTLHNVTFATAAGAPANIGEHSSGTNSRTFSTPGSYSYSCTLHAGMSGTVEVAN